MLCLNHSQIKNHGSHGISWMSFYPANRHVNFSGLLALQIVVTSDNLKNISSLVSIFLSITSHTSHTHTSIRATFSFALRIPWTQWAAVRTHLRMAKEKVHPKNFCSRGWKVFYTTYLSDTKLAAQNGLFPSSSHRPATHGMLPGSTSKPPRTRGETGTRQKETLNQQPMADGWMMVNGNKLQWLLGFISLSLSPRPKPRERTTSLNKDELCIITCKNRYFLIFQYHYF